MLDHARRRTALGALITPLLSEIDKKTKPIKAPVFGGGPNPPAPNSPVVPEPNAPANPIVPDVNTPVTQPEPLATTSSIAPEPSAPAAQPEPSAQGSLPTGNSNDLRDQLKLAASQSLGHSGQSPEVSKPSGQVLQQPTNAPDEQKASSVTTSPDLGNLRIVRQITANHLGLTIAEIMSRKSYEGVFAQLIPGDQAELQKAQDGPAARSLVTPAPSNPGEPESVSHSPSKVVKSIEQPSAYDVIMKEVNNPTLYYGSVSERLPNVFQQEGSRPRRSARNTLFQSGPIKKSEATKPSVPVFKPVDPTPEEKQKNFQNLFSADRFKEIDAASKSFAAPPALPSNSSVIDQSFINRAKHVLGQSVGSPAPATNSLLAQQPGFKFDFKKAVPPVRSVGTAPPAPSAASSPFSFNFPGSSGSSEVLRSSESLAVARAKLSSASNRPVPQPSMIKHGQVTPGNTPAPPEQPALSATPALLDQPEQPLDSATLRWIKSMDQPTEGSEHVDQPSLLPFGELTEPAKPLVDEHDDDQFNPDGSSDEWDKPIDGEDHVGQGFKKGSVGYDLRPAYDIPLSSDEELAKRSDRGQRLLTGDEVDISPAQDITIRVSALSDADRAARFRGLRNVSHLSVNRLNTLRNRMSELEYAFSDAIQSMTEEIDEIYDTLIVTGDMLS